MAHDREVGGIRCFEVLETLSDYLDGELDAGTVARIEAHLAGCDWCESFGNRFSSTVKALRSTLSDTHELDDKARARLRDRLASALDEEA